MRPTDFFALPVRDQRRIKQFPEPWQYFGLLDAILNETEPIIKKRERAIKIQLLIVLKKTLLRKSIWCAQNDC